MSGEDRAQRDMLLERIRTRRESIAQYVDDLRPRGNRLANLSIVASALAAVLTAGPALGGSNFAEGAQSTLGLQASSTVWQILCLAAMVVSVVAAITSNLLKRQDAVTRISAAESAGAELESLQTALEFDQVSVADAVNVYQGALTRIPFVPETPRERSGGDRPERPRPTRLLAETFAPPGARPPGPGQQPHQPLVILDDRDTPRR